jgi:plastocyanin
VTAARNISCTVLLLCLCGCSGGNGNPGGPSTPGNTNVITISSSGSVSPVEIVVSPGARVLFVNNDSRRHEMTSDPHPDHQNCPEINQVGLLGPGQSRETGNLVAVRTCGFHDHENPDANGLKGRIVIR